MLKILRTQSKCILFCLLICGSFITKKAIAQPGNAISLNGVDQGLIVHRAGNPFYSRFFTVEAWVKPVNVTGSMAVITSKRDTKRRGDRYFEIALSGGKSITLYFNFVYIWNSSGIYLGNTGGSSNFKFEYKSNTWYHIAMAVDQYKYTLYINGQFVGSAPFNDASGGNTAEATLFGGGDIVTLGSYRGGSRLKGSVDEVKIYDTTLSADNIQSDMRSTAISKPDKLVIYYNFNKYGSTGDSIMDLSGHNYNSFVTGTPPALKESYATVVPIATAATNITDTSFTANWVKPVTGFVTNYLLDVAKDSAFTHLVSGYNALVVTGTSQAVTGLIADSQYYYRVRADKSSLPGQGAYSNTIIVGKTKHAPTIASFHPKIASTDSVITITGTNFTGALAVAFGGTPAASFKVINSTTIKAVVAAGSTGSVAVTTAGGKATKDGFSFKFIPVITSFTPYAATAGQTVTITGISLMGATEVSFGGTPATSFTVVSPTTVKAVVGGGASGKISITTAGGKSAKAGFTYTTCPPVFPSVKIVSDKGDSICLHTSVTLAATPTNGGATPAYQWVKNGVNVGTNSSTYTDNALAHDDSVWVVLTSNATCVVPTTIASKKIIFLVSDGAPAQPSAITGPDQVTWGQDKVAFSVIKVNNVTYAWTVPPGMSLEDGQGTNAIHLHWDVNESGNITVTGGNYCGTSPVRTKAVTVFHKPAAVKATATTAQVNNAAKIAIATAPYLKIYPNPAITNVTVEFTTAVPGKYEATLVNAVGQLINNTSGVSTTGVNKITLDMTKYTAGMYYVRLLDAEHKTRIIKVVKTR